MEYAFIGVIGFVIVLAILPFSIRNSKKYKQDRIAKKAKSFGVELDFGGNE